MLIIYYVLKGEFDVFFFRRVKFWGEFFILVYLISFEGSSFYYLERYNFNVRRTRCISFNVFFWVGGLLCLFF